jgi:hypothetical protein
LWHIGFIIRTTIAAQWSASTTKQLRLTAMLRRIGQLNLKNKYVNKKLNNRNPALRLQKVEEEVVDKSFGKISTQASFPTEWGFLLKTIGGEKVCDCYFWVNQNLSLHEKNPRQRRN